MREFPPLEECFLLWMLHDFGGRIQGGSDRVKKKRGHSTLSQGVLCEGLFIMIGCFSTSLGSCSIKKKRHGGGQALCAIRYHLRLVGAGALVFCFPKLTSGPLGQKESTRGRLTSTQNGP